MVGPHRTRLVGVEGLRAAAALSVVAHHVWYFGAANGRESFGLLDDLVFYRLGEGLTLFFALSGFLLYRQFATRTLSGSPFPSVRRFAVHRALRIIPAYWVILGIVTLAGLAEWGGGDPARLLVRNLFLVQSYTPSGLQTGIGPAWSLVVEAAFYLVLPAVAWLGWKAAAGPAHGGRRLTAALAPGAGMILVGWLGRAVARLTIDPANAYAEQWGATWHAVFERSLLCQADLFGWGMVAAVLVCFVEAGRVDGRVVGRIAAAGAVVMWVGSTALVAYGDLDYAVYKTLSSIACAALIVSVVAPGTAEGRGRRLLEWKPVAAIGVISYSVYLWHVPVVTWLRESGMTTAGRPQFMVNMVLVLAMTLPLAALTYRWVERPALGRRRPQTLAGTRAEQESAVATP